MNANASVFGFGGTSWKEEVLLNDGSKIIVERAVSRGGRHEISQKSPISEQTLSFRSPATNEQINWKVEASPDVKLAELTPLLLDVARGIPYLVTDPVGCLSFNKWNRPNPPYVAFKYAGKAWVRIAVTELPAEIKVPNLIISSPDANAKVQNQRVISAEAIRRLNNELNQPEYKTILREAQVIGRAGCEELILYKGHWIMPNDSVGRSIVDKKVKAVEHQLPGG